MYLEGFSATPPETISHRDESVPGFYLSQTVKYLDAVLFSCSPDGKQYYFITPAVEKITGITAEECLQHPMAVMRMVHPEDLHEIRQMVLSIKDKKPVTVEYRLLNKKKQLLYLRHTSYPIYEDGAVTRIDGIIYNVTGEKENELRLKKSEDRLRSIIDTAEDLIFVLDYQGKFISVNNSGALNLEYLPYEITGKHFLHFADEEHKEDIAKAFQHILKNKKVITFDAFLKSKYGKTIVFEVNARAIYENERLDGVVGIGRNITVRRSDQEKMKDLNNKLIEANRIISIERDRAKQKISILEELNRLKNEFVSNISHELRTPLASIVGFSETIDSDASLPDGMRSEFNQVILHEAKRLSKLINDVLDISKIEEGKIVLSKSEFAVNEILEPLIEQYSKKSLEKGLIFWSELPSDQPRLFGDKTRLYQVFENILSNALKFTNEGRITLLAQTFYNEFEVIITDTGIGIPKKDIPFLFQKFYRVSRPGSEIPGTGIGLAIAKQIIDMHKGYISLKSDFQNGTTAVIKLPIIKQQQNSRE